MRALATLGDFDAVKDETRCSLRCGCSGSADWSTASWRPLPLIGSLCLRHFTVCRSLRRSTEVTNRATIVIPARNERGNIEAAVKRIPRFAETLEIIFVEGHSRDGTWEEIERVAAAYPDRDIKAMRQPGTGKGDAVFRRLRCRARRRPDDPRCRSDHAAGAVAEVLGRDPLRQGRIRQRLAARLSDGAGGDALSQSVANKAFSLLFTWLLSQRFTDTLCGTKAMRRSDYARIKGARSYFGEFDPFGDFELIFGASKLGLKAVEIPIRYASRTYGETQISRFRHGFMLLRMVLFAFMRIKAM